MFEKEYKKLESYFTRVKKKLDNPDFCSKAPKEVVDAEKMRFKEAEIKLREIKDHMDQMPR